MSKSGAFSEPCSSNSASAWFTCALATLPLGGGIFLVQRCRNREGPVLLFLTWRHVKHTVGYCETAGFFFPPNYVTVTLLSDSFFLGCFAYSQLPQQPYPTSTTPGWIDWDPACHRSVRLVVPGCFLASAREGCPSGGGPPNIEPSIGKSCPVYPGKAAQKQRCLIRDALKAGGTIPCVVRTSSSHSKCNCRGRADFSRSRELKWTLRAVPPTGLRVAMFVSASSGRELKVWPGCVGRPSSCAVSNSNPWSCWS